MSHYKTPSSKISRMALKAMYPKTAQDESKSDASRQTTLSSPSKPAKPSVEKRPHQTTLVVWGSPDGETQEFLRAIVRVVGEVDSSVVSLVPKEQQSSPDSTSNSNHALLIEGLRYARKSSAVRTVVLLQRIASAKDVQDLASHWIVKPVETTLVRVWVPDTRADEEWSNTILDTERHAQLLGFRVVTIVGQDLETAAAWILLHAGLK